MVATIIAAPLLMMLVVAPSSPAHAATIFTVTNTTDANNICDAGCSLREAITAANSTPNSGGPDLIRFNINQSSVQTIKPTSELPAITEAVTIDGYTQSGASSNTLARGTNAKILVELDGSNAGTADGLQIEASNAVVRGLAINRFTFEGIHLVGSDVSGVKVEGNFIGTDPSGTQDRGNASQGVHIEGGQNNTVGGTTPEARNLISGNSFTGVLVTGEGANRVQGNLIGTSKDGKSPLGNGSTGVHIISSSNNAIGGAEPGSANTIAFNGLDGVFVISDSSGNHVLGNSIFSNAQLGIDLSGGSQNAAGDTLNDPGDADEGPNGLQNKPVIRSATTSSDGITIKGKLNSVPSRAFTVQFFSSPSGSEGKKFIGQKIVTTEANGNVSFSFKPQVKVRRGVITATATDVFRNTSEFSAPERVVAQ